MNLAQDVRYALRTLRWNPGFAAVAVIAIALGVGANTALYSILHAIYLRPLPVDRPEQMVVVSTLNQSFSYPMYRELRDRNQSLQGLLAHRTLDVHIGLDGSVERGTGVLVSGNYFPLLGVGAIAGTPIAPGDDVTPMSGGARGPVAVLSHSYWQRRLGGARDVVGRRIHLNGSPFTIVGVAEPGFSGLEVGTSPDVFAPMMMQGALQLWNARGMEQPLNVWLRIFGRLRTDVPSAQAAADLTNVWQQFFQYKVPNLTAERRTQLAQRRVNLTDASTGTSGLRSRYSQPLTVLMSVAGFVLLIACANVASLLLTRATGRQREISIRLALGATGRRLVSQLLIESLVLAVLGGALGLLLARMIRDIVLLFLPQAEQLKVTLDAPVLAFSLLLALATGILFGLVPSVQATSNIKPASGGGSRFQLRQGLVVLQVALSLVLLAGAGVFLRSLRNLDRMDPGFTRENVLTFDIDAGRNGYTADAARQLCERLLDRLGQLPGVKSAGIADFTPLNMHTGNTIEVEGYQPRRDEPSNDPGVGSITPGYFGTMGVPLLLGRDIGLRDQATTPKVAVINQAFARHFFGDASPLSKRMGFGKGTFDVEIVGVVGNMKLSGLRESPQRMVFMSAWQRSIFGFGGGIFHVRTAGDPAALAPMVRAEVRALDPSLPVANMSTVRQHVDRGMMQEQLVATVSTLFGSLALVLSAVGIFGVMSYAVSRRTREIGIRMALGEERGSIAARVVKEAAGLTLAGVAIGMPAAYAILRLVSGLLFGLTPADPVSAVAAISVLGLTAFLAAWIPARRASRVDPMIALRHE